MGHKILLLITLSVLLYSCKENKKENESSSLTPPDFSVDSAYAFVTRQVAFGPRVPGSSSHKACGDWLVSKLASYGLKMTEQPFSATTYNGQTIKGRNIIGSLNPQASKRIIVASHWDSRPFADKDSVDTQKAIDGANDGASGVGVILEIARMLQSQKTDVGVDFILFDVEDGGAPESFKGKSIGEYGGYCLGSEYWSKNLHQPSYTAYYGILLDMVGAPNATFRMEGVSNQVAPNIVQNIWNTAAQLGFGNIFIQEQAPQITDDHVPVILNAKIPMVDIIDLKLSDKVFFSQHHTHGDNLKAIDKNTLKAVGQTLLQVIKSENTEI